MIWATKVEFLLKNNAHAIIKYMPANNLPIIDKWNSTCTNQREPEIGEALKMCVLTEQNMNLTPPQKSFCAGIIIYAIMGSILYNVYLYQTPWELTVDLSCFQGQYADLFCM